MTLTTVFPPLSVSRRVSKTQRKAIGAVPAVSRSKQRVVRCAAAGDEAQTSAQAKTVSLEEEVRAMERRLDRARYGV